MTFRLVLLLGSLFVVLSFAQAQLINNNIIVEQYTTSDGLSHSSISSIVQDNSGFLWIGTENGLNRFDGFEFKRIAINSNISTSKVTENIYKLFKTANYLWIGLNPNGLCLYSITKQQFINIIVDGSPAEQIHKLRVFAIEQVNDSVCFIGTDKGLYSCRLNINSKQCPVAVSLEKAFDISIQVNCILRQKNGTLWIGTNKGLINRYLPYNKSYQKQNNKENRTELKTSITSIYEDKHNNLWIGTEKSGLYLARNATNLKRLSFEQIIYQSFTYQTKNYISKILEDNRSNLWIGTNLGVSRINITQVDSLLITHYLDTKDYIDGKNQNMISQIIETSNGEIWISCNTNNLGIGIYDRKMDQFQFKQTILTNVNKYTSNFFKVIYEDRYGNVWLGGIKTGLNKIDIQRKPFHIFYFDDIDNQKNNSNVVYSIFEDKEKKMWIGTNTGLHKIEHNKIQSFTHIQQGGKFLQGEMVSAINQDSKGNLWIGYFDSQLDMLEPTTGKITHFLYQGGKANTIVSWSIRTLFIDKSDNLWIGSSSGGLGVYLNTEKQFEYFMPNPPNYDDASIAEGKSGIINDVWINCITEDSNGNLWIGTRNGGVNIFNKTDKTFKNLKNNPNDINSLGNNEVFSLLFDSNGYLWIGTGAGLDRFDFQNNIFKHFNTNSGLSSNTIYGILEDDEKNLWISTANGLVKMNLYSFVCQIYDERNYLLSGEFNTGAYCRNSEGHLFFGTNRGLVYFNPKDISPNPYIPKLVFTEMKIMNKKVNIGDTIFNRVILTQDLNYLTQIKIPTPVSFFTLEFAGIHYGSPKTIRYKYILEGYDKQWNECDNQNRFVSFKNLPPNKYLLKIKLTDLEGNWLEHEKILEIDILPYWWQTIWFKLIIIALFIYLLYFAYYIRTKNLKRHKKILEKKVAQRTDQLSKSNKLLTSKQLEIEQQYEKIKQINELKTNFFVNISHELRTPLTLILSPAEKLCNSNSSNNWTIEPYKSYRHIHKNALSLYKLINQLLDIQKVESGQTKLILTKGNLISFTRGIVYLFETSAVEKNITLSFNSSIETLIMDYDHDKMEKILFNLLSNALKFSNINQTIHIIISIENVDLQKYVCIKVIDNGKGIPPEKLPFIFDRFFQADTSNETVGSGIGLSYTKDLVELHKGKIQVESIVNKETVFSIFLPIINDIENIPSETIDNEILNSNIQNVEDEALQPILLIVEDNIELNTYISEELQTNYFIIKACNGREGLMFAQEHLPDLIVCDIMMPIMNGIEMCKSIKTDERTSHIPVILLTAKTYEESKIEAFEANADDYITKPFNMNFLKTRLSNILRNREILRQKFSKENNYSVKEIATNTTEAKILSKIITYVESQYHNPELDAEEIGRETGLSRSQLYRKLNSLTGLSVNEFVNTLRIKKAAELLKENPESISEVIYAVGFNSRGNFYKCFKKQYNMTPKEFLEK